MNCDICNDIIKTPDIKYICSSCAKELSITEREELEYLRAWKKREEEHLKGLIGSVVYEKYVNGTNMPGVKLNFT